MFFCMRQVADYGLGGEYNAHRDTHGPARTPPQPGVGERLATVLTYLQTPSQGKAHNIMFLSHVSQIYVDENN